MEIIIGKSAGFCFGVSNAVNKTIDLLTEESKQMYCLGELVHNKQVTEELQNKLNIKFLRHILNTSGIQRLPEYQMDMVRMGIGLYGIGIDENSPIRPVATLKTRILQIKELDEDQTVGYNRKGKLNRKSKIAAIPIGYADGLDRHLSCGRWSMLVEGKAAPIVGRVCMDSCMIDVTDIKGVKEGDQVVVFSPKAGNSAEDMAEELATIPYEIITSVAARVKRIYVRE